MIDADKLIEALEAERDRYDAREETEWGVVRDVLSRVILAVQAVRASREE